MQKICSKQNKYLINLQTLQRGQAANGGKATTDSGLLKERLHEANGQPLQRPHLRQPLELPAEESLQVQFPHLPPRPLENVLDGNGGDWGAAHQSRAHLEHPQTGREVPKRACLAQSIAAQVEVEQRAEAAHDNGQLVVVEVAVGEGELRQLASKVVDQSAPAPYRHVQVVLLVQAAST